MTIIYHKGCLDGFTSAWVIQKFTGVGDESFIPSDYTNLKSNIKKAILEESKINNPQLFILDLSIDQVIKELETIDTYFKGSITLIDHHEIHSNLSELSKKFENVIVVRDTSKSSSLLCWEYIVKDKDKHIPEIIRIINDTDTNSNKIEGAKELCFFIKRRNFSFETWDYVNKSLEECNGDIKSLKEFHEGRLLLHCLKERITPLCEQPSLLLVGGYIIAAVNTRMDCNEVCNALFREYGYSFEFYGVYWSCGVGRVRVSLRSYGGRDVSSIANLYGGGGHKGAASFTVDSGLFKSVMLIKKGTTYSFK